MREILFRGKRIDGHRDNTKNGTMLYGSLFIDKNGQPKIKWYCEKHGSAMTSNVDPETVGQYIGMTDSNGNKVFEGDIVRITSGAGCPKPIVGAIHYERSGFHFKFGKDGSALFYDWAKQFYVIGNIHDNPELLEVKC